jgi:hypothetical protein
MDISFTSRAVEGLGRPIAAHPVERNIELIARFMRRDPGQQKIG